MATNQLIKRVFGNHNSLQQYLNYLSNPDDLPPFMPVLYRQIRHRTQNDEEIIAINLRSEHCAKNRQVMEQLVIQYQIYSHEIQNE